MVKPVSIFLAIIAPLALRAAAADTGAIDTARAAVRGASPRTVVANRASNAANNTSASHSGATVSRTTSTAAASQSAAVTRDAARTVAGPRSGTVVNDAARTSSAPRTATPAVTPRTTATPVTTRASRNTITAATPIATRTTASATRGARTAAAPVQTTTSARRATRTATSSAAARGAASVQTATRGAMSVRSATTGAATDREQVMSKNYSKCRTVYYDCMDEFCANKDSQLKRCACSARVNEFDGVKKQLADVEEKMLDFNQRLLTVSMDKEDAEALFKATEGELAFQQEDKSESKKILDSLSKKLKDSTKSSFNTDLSAISLSLDMDAAFDSVDSLMGAQTTTKTGTALYSAALPVCREMAAEVCSEDELAIVTSGYQMSIEQDCNTVARAYSTQTDQARSKVLEGSALLDMSRLNIYQQRNSDDILACKKKMLDALSDTSVCGTGLGKCLDTSGRYIDPTTGEAFLTENLADLSKLITRPSGDETWSNAAGNDKFVTFLNSKKKFLEPAMENCQDISEYVWKEFIEDALAQIKLAQDKKLEDMRQSCTTLTTQCLSNAAKTLADFDSRALSVFGVAADKTANAMCAEIKTACTALMNTGTATTPDSTDGTNDWKTGMDDISTDTTYATILQTCREVGRQCIITTCKSVSGNFGLCENIQTSINRKAIINYRSCWNEVYNCVANAGNDAINNITARLIKSTELDETKSGAYNLDTKFSINKNGQSEENIATIDTEDPQQSEQDDKSIGWTFYKFLYGDDNKQSILDICSSNYCGNDYNTPRCRTCRIAERIWGNCEHAPEYTTENSATYSNQIKKPILDDQETLLYWFAKNTGTENKIDSCRDTSCSAGQRLLFNGGAQMCIAANNDAVTTGDNSYCPNQVQQLTVEDSGTTNCCTSGILEKEKAGDAKLTHPNCCVNGTTQQPKYASLIDSENVFSVLTDSESKPAIPFLCATKGGKTTYMPANANLFVVAHHYDTPNSMYKLLICASTEKDISTALSKTGTETNFPNGKDIKCNGQYILVEMGANNTYTAPTLTTDDKGKTTIQKVILNHYYKDGNPNITTQVNKINYGHPTFIDYNYNPTASTETASSSDTQQDNQ